MELSPALIDRIAQAALVHGDRQADPESLLREWDELFPGSKDRVRKMVRDVIAGIHDVGLVIVPADG